MNNKLTLFFLLAACCFQGLSAQTNVDLQLHHKMGSQDFELNTPTTAPGGYAIKFNRLQYYVSEISIVHDGGQVTPATNLHLLVSAEKGGRFELGSFPVTNVEGIEFSIGVEEAFNHLDPSAYPASNPLAPQNPSMHWGWVSGYRFVCLEGVSSNNGTTFPDIFEVHALGDDNYQSLTLLAGGVMTDGRLVINIDADYLGTLTGLNVQGGLVSHGETGASIFVMENMKNHVFTASVVSGVTEPGVAGSFSVSPNPTNGPATVRFDLPGYQRLMLTVSDLSGREVLEQSLSGSSGTFVLPVDWQAGIYFATVRSGDKVLAQEKLIVK